MIHEDIEEHSGREDLERGKGKISSVIALAHSMSLISFSGLPVVLPDQTEAVLVGAAVLGACASRHYSSIQVE